LAKRPKLYKRMQRDVLAQDAVEIDSEAEPKEDGREEYSDNSTASRGNNILARLHGRWPAGRLSLSSKRSFNGQPGK
jgi:hypothetical protein